MITTKFAYYAAFRGCPLIRYNFFYTLKYFRPKAVNPKLVFPH